MIPDYHRVIFIFYVMIHAESSIFGEYYRFYRRDIGDDVHIAALKLSQLIPTEPQYDPLDLRTLLVIVWVGFNFDHRLGDMAYVLVGAISYGLLPELPVE